MTGLPATVGGGFEPVRAGAAPSAARAPPAFWTAKRRGDGLGRFAVPAAMQMRGRLADGGSQRPAPGAVLRDRYVFGVVEAGWSYSTFFRYFPV